MPAWRAMDNQFARNEQMVGKNMVYGDKNAWPQVAVKGESDLHVQPDAPPCVPVGKSECRKPGEWRLGLLCST